MTESADAEFWMICVHSLSAVSAGVVGTKRRCFTQSHKGTKVIVVGIRTAAVGDDEVDLTDSNWIKAFDYVSRNLLPGKVTGRPLRERRRDSEPPDR
jgi:hypothetical protein